MRRKLWIKCNAVLTALAFTMWWAAAAADGLSVKGSQLTLDGRPFLVKGVQLVGLVAPESALSGVFAEAHRHFGRPELTQIQRWNANTIRFQLSQPGLDKASTLYSEGYVAEVREAVKLARSMGFVVIASVQDHRPSGEGDPKGMPTEGTLRACETLASLFGSDTGVAIEPFNEPVLKESAPKPSPEAWSLWLRGGVGANSEILVGMQTLVTRLRQVGARNVLVVDGLRFSQTFEGCPLIEDPAREIVYGIHPYLRRRETESEWQRNFGFLTDRGLAVLASEWSAPTWKKAGKDPWCNKLPLSTAAKLLEFLKAKRIGVVGWAFDIPGTIVRDFNGTPTTLENVRCGDSGGGPGELLQKFFMNPVN
jgi:endoglucanase